MAAGTFFPFFHVAISKQRYAYNGRYDIFDQGQPVGHIVFIIGPATEGVQRFYYATEAEPYFDGNREAWRALEKAYKAGKLRSIAVSNFEQPETLRSAGRSLQLRSGRKAETSPFDTL
jgi:hypothetical protein